MTTLGLTGRIWIGRDPIDVLKSYDRLVVVVTTALGRDPLSDDSFDFKNRCDDHLKILGGIELGSAMRRPRYQRPTPT